MKRTKLKPRKRKTAVPPAPVPPPIHTHQVVRQEGWFDITRGRARVYAIYQVCQDVHAGVPDYYTQVILHYTYSDGCPASTRTEVEIIKHVSAVETQAMFMRALEMLLDELDRPATLNREDVEEWVDGLCGNGSLCIFTEPQVESIRDSFRVNFR